jgi:ribosome-associated protein
LDKHAEDVLILDVARLSGITDYFVICTADNARQIKAIQDHLEKTAREAGARVLHSEGEVTTNAVAALHEYNWVLLDCGDVVVHIMDRAARAFYRLEHLWADAPRVPFEELRVHRS